MAPVDQCSLHRSWHSKVNMFSSRVAGCQGVTLNGSVRQKWLAMYKVEVKAVDRMG